MKVSLAPIPYYWPKETVFRFYDSIAASPVDIVYLGETVCAKRHELRFEDWVKIAEQLQDAGKAVFFSTQVLLESDTHLNTMRKITGNALFPVEANDMGAVRCLAGRHGFVAGMHLNIYNPSSLRLMKELGAVRWVMPVEMNGTDLQCMKESLSGEMEVEVFAYGRIPLAFSARCFTARYYDLPKDDCHFRCLDHPEGLTLQTREKKDFLVLNGIQTQSGHVYCLLREIPELRKKGVDVIRISPQYSNTAEIIRVFSNVIQHKLEVSEAEAILSELMPGKPSNGYWHGHPGMDFVCR